MLRWRPLAFGVPETAGGEAVATFCVSPPAATDPSPPVGEVPGRLLVIVEDVGQLCVLQSVILSSANQKQRHKLELESQSVAF